MGARGKKKKVKGKPQETYGSDDERTYKNERVPHPEDNDFYHDEVDDFHSNREKISLERGAALDPGGTSFDEKEVEVLGLESESGDDNDEILEYKERLRKLRHHQHIKTGYQSEEEEEEDEETGGLTSDKSWGKKKRRFYDADVQDDDVQLEGSGSEPEDAALEEQEALRLQKKMAEELDEEDFGLDIFTSVSSKPAAQKAEEEKIATDMSKLSRRDKLELLQKESPELLDLMEDYKSKMSVVSEHLMPLNELIKSGKMATSSGTKYIQTKLALYLNYCVNVSFYLMLKAKHAPQVTSHPVVKRLLQHRKLMKEMEEADQQMEPQVEEILQKLADGEEIKMAATSGSSGSAVSRILKKAKKKATEMKRVEEIIEEEEEFVDEADIGKGGRSWGRKRKAEDGMTSGEREAMEFYDAIKTGKKKRGEVRIREGTGDAMDDVIGDVTVEDEMAEDEKRGVTYQILKNKGLQAPKKKELRNPRVKHRMKFRKAKIRRKGQVREPRTEMTRYGGEISGIRAGIKRSVKFK